MDLNEEIKSKIREISKNKNYWFVRTQGGDYYENFINGEFISIGYDKILLFDVDQLKNSPNPTEALADKVRKYYEDNLTPTHTANQILKFVNEINKGDIVLIPSTSSNHITFGEVTDSKTYLKSESKDIDNCPFEKRKKVKWIKTVQKLKLNPNLYRLIYSHHAITEANFYDQYIDKTLNSFFIKYNRAHLVIDVATNEGINARELFTMGLQMFECVDSFSKSNNYNASSDDIEIKTNLESPGTVEFISNSVLALTIIGLIIVLLNGGNFELNLRITAVKVNSPGLIKKISEFLNDKQNRKTKDAITEHLKKLQIQNPEDVAKILNQLQDKNEPENNNTAS